jgi:hypothetical protein
LQWWNLKWWTLDSSSIWELGWGSNLGNRLHRFCNRRYPRTTKCPKPEKSNQGIRCYYTM